jgi:hypothetical protein
MDEWKLPWQGGCRCGAVRFEVSKAPLLAGACHCTGCRRMTGSAYSLTLSVPPDGFAVTSGAPVRGGLREGVSHHFHCPDCKSWMFTRIEGLDWFVNLRATMLDDHGWFEPYVELWTDEGFGWAPTGAPHSYGTAPDFAEFDRLMREYAAEGKRPPG